MSGDRPAPLAGIRAWLFDFDNTIAALEPQVDWAGSRNELEIFLRSAGIADTIFAEIPKGNLPLYDALYHRLLKREPPDAIAVAGRARSEPRELLREASALIEVHELIGAERAEPLPGAIELLHALAARDNPVLIVTSNSSRTVAHWLERFGLRQCVKSIIGRDSMLPLKPAPDTINLAIERAAQPARAARFVGDSDADALAAKRAAVPFYGIARDAEKRARLLAQGAIEVFRDPANLAARFALSN
jgi:phosphoglycolate phosphatase-like HAD superfamily hydrolase